MSWRCLFLGLTACLAAALFGAAAPAQDKPADARAPAQPADAAQPAEAADGDLTLRQGRVADKFARLEELMLRTAQFEADANPQRAELLKKAVRLSQDNFTRKQLEQLVELLSTQQYRVALERQDDALIDLRALLKLLQSEDRNDRNRNEQDRIKEYIKEVERLIRIQRGLQGQTEGGVPAEPLAQKQGDAANRAGDLGRKIGEDEAVGGADGENKGESDADNKGKSEGDSKGNKEGDSKSKSEGDSKSKSEGDNKGDSESDSKGKSESDSKGNKEGDSKSKSEGDSKSKSEGDNKGDSESDSKGKSESDSKGNKEGDSKSKSEGDSKSKSEGDSKGKSESDSKGNSESESKGNKEGDSKSKSEGDSKGKSEGDSKGKSESESKGDSEGDSKGNKEGDSKSKSKGDSKGSSQGDSKGDSESESEGPEGGPKKKQDENPARQRIREAEEKMRQAQRKLEEAKRKDAVEDQEEARKKLEEAKAELERILRQLREEEIERMLALLEGRFRKMLEMQLKVYEGTLTLDKIPAAQRDAKTDIQAGKLGFEQRKIAGEAERALVLLREEGSSVAFPEAVDQIEDDMQQSADRLARTEVGRLTQTIQEDIIAALKEMIDALEKAQQEMQEQKSQQGEGQQGQPQDPPLVDALAELKLIKSMQIRVNDRTKRYSRLIQNIDDPIGQADDKDLQGALQKLAERQQKIEQITRDVVLERAE